MVEIEINGRMIQARAGSMLIEAADEAGISIPRFCYHKKLSIAANCRMCLVDVEKAPKPLPACATPVTEGMRVFTKSEKALEAQKGTMEFLLINHPLDCPICDQGGECDLQDVAMGFGEGASRYTEKKRVVLDKNLGPLIATDMTRCIHCTRCVRFGQEVAGIMELGATGRGEHMEIGTYVHKAISSEMSGNMIDLCPVGALTSKPYRYSGRSWDNNRIDSIAPHDCIGTNVLVEVCRNQVRRVLPRENETINETWISDRDRFSYSALYSEQRLKCPMIKQGKSWREVDWQTALEYTVQGLKTVIQQHGAKKVGSLVAPSATVEEMYLLQKLIRGLGSNNIDHRLLQQDFSDQDVAPLFPYLGQSIEDLEQKDAVLLIGSHIRKDQPIAAHRLRKAALQGAKIMVVNAVAYDFNFQLKEQLISSPAGMVTALAAITKALLDITEAQIPSGLSTLLQAVEVQDAHLAVAKHLYNSENTSVLIGSQSMGQIEFADLRALANVIAKLSLADLGYLSQGANSAGAWLAGVLPHRGPVGITLKQRGLDAQSMLKQGMHAYVLMGLEPEFDCADPSVALKAIQDAEFVVSLTPFVTDTMKEYGNVLLPTAPFTETSGTYVNVEGRWQSFGASVAPLGDARPGWKVLRVLGNLFELSDFDYMTSEEVRDELKPASENITPDAKSESIAFKSLPQINGAITRIGYVPIYAVDNLVRRATPLQETVDAMRTLALYMSAHTAHRVGLQDGQSALVVQGECRVTLPVAIDDDVADHCVVIPAGLPGSHKLGSSYGVVELSRA